MRILFLSAWFPYPPDNGSKLRIYNLLRGLTQHHHVTLIVMTDMPISEKSEELSVLCEHVHVVQLRPYNPKSVRSLAGIISATPRVIVSRHDPSITDFIEKEVRNGRFDLVIASQWPTAAYLDAFGEMPAIFEEVELGSFLSKKTSAKSFIRRFRHDLTLLKLGFYLRGLLPNYHACTVVSKEESTILRKFVPEYEHIHVVPNFLDLMDYQEYRNTPRSNRLIFTGSFRYRPNYEAMVWFVNDIFPQIKARVPNVTLTITGDHANLRLPPEQNINLTGRVKDVRPLIASSSVCIVPIRAGGGTRLKILEAMALGTPVVATSKGAEGIVGEDNRHFLLADSCDDFSDAVVSLLRQPGLRQRLASNGYKLLRDNYSKQAIMPGFLSLVNKVARS